MKISVSDLAFGGFRAKALAELPIGVGVEFFYEFGTDLYWDKVCGEVFADRSLSMHAPCVGVNLADPGDETYLAVYEKTLDYAQKCNALFVVVHSNEAWSGEREQAKQLVESRLAEIIALAKKKKVTVLLENVGLRNTGTLLYDWHDYLQLLDKFPKIGALIDLGHANVNGWNITEMLVILGKRIKAVHLHDNNGKADQHLPIGKGNIDWKAYFKRAKQLIPEAVHVLEYAEISSDKLQKHLKKIEGKYLAE